MRKIFLLFACAATMHLSAENSVMIANFEDDGSDKYAGFEEYRIREEGGPFVVVDNPKPTDANSSSKVLKLYDVTSAGRLGIGLCGYWDGSAYVPFTNPSDSIVIYDQENAVANYDTFRCKLYLEGETTNENLLPYIEFFNYGADPQPARDLGVWEHPVEGMTTWNDWNTITIQYTPQKEHARFVLVINNGIWGDDPDVTFYVDDIEFFDSYSVSVKEYGEDKLDYILNGKDLLISNVADNSIFSIVDICGKSLVKSVASGEIAYSFPAAGVYVISVKNGNDVITQKVLVK